MRLALWLWVLVFTVWSCSANSGSDPATGGAGGVSPSGGAGGSGGSLTTDGGGSGGTLADGGSQLPAVGHLKGRVFAPEGTIPIAGALVYLAPAPPAGIPQNVYCDRCVEIDQTVPFTFAGPDGIFDLGFPTVGSFYIVVRKGQFQRARRIDVVAGEQYVDTGLTTLPKKTDAAAFDYIPRMAIASGSWDAVDVTLAKLGLGTLKAGILGRPTIDAHEFDIFPSTQMLRDKAKLGQYHVIFIPCSGSADFGASPQCGVDSLVSDSTVKQNLDEWVAAGGKLYVTDWSYEFVRQPFPGRISWQGETSQLGSACGGEWDGAATVKDPDMQTWLATQPTGAITSFDVKANWTMIDAVHPVPDQDADGQPITVTPKVWVEGATSAGPKAATVSFEHRCGRVLFSTYHTEADQGSFTTLLAQERALLYILLEVGVCIGPPPVPA